MTRAWVRRLGAVTGAGVLSVTALTAVVTVSGTQQAQALANGLALTPPMGWNGYERYGTDVTASIVEADARALVSSGMKKDGYDYVNLDGGWDLLQRSADGQLQPDPSKFPDGIKPVADYVHSLGLKFGIYTSAGTTNCAGTSAGSYGHYQQDADTFASWGVDYVKVDWCSIPTDQFPGLTPPQLAQQLYGQFSQAVAKTKRPMVVSINAGVANLQPLDWAPGVANLWRTTADVADNFDSVVSNFTQTAALAQLAGPGAWNDPDMLEVGNGGMTTTEYRTQFSLWAEMAAPLLASTDLTTMSAATKAIFTNTDVIAVDQDPLGQQGQVISSADGLWVLSKPLADGGRAVVLFNQNDTPAVISTTASQAGLGQAPAYDLRDLWSHTTTESAGMISAAVAPHAVVMYRVTPASNPARVPPNTSLGLSTDSAGLVPGQPAVITATFINNGTFPVRNVGLSVHAPRGWTVQPSSPTLFSVVGSGQTVQAQWQVTATASSGTYQLAAAATYYSGNHGKQRAVATLAVGIIATAQVGVLLAQQNQDYGLDQIESGDGLTTPVTVGGLSGRQTILVVPADYNIYFGVDDSIASNGSYTATFTFQYYDQGTGSLILQYDSTNPNGGAFSGAYTTATVIQETNTGTWKTVSYTVPDARFADRENFGADFRLISNTPFTVHSMVTTITGPGVPPVSLWPFS